MPRDDSKTVKVISGVSALIGAWLALSPFLLNYSSPAARWTQVTFGLFVLLLSGLRFFLPQLEWPSWFVGLIGLWLIVAPYLLGYGWSVAYWNEVISGIVVSVLAFWNLDTYTEHTHRPI